MQFSMLKKISFILILIIVTWAFLDMLIPYFSSIFWATILTIIFYPVKNKIRTIFAKQDGLASFLTIGIICLIVFIPLIFIISSLIIEINSICAKIQQNEIHFSEVIIGLLTHMPEWMKIFFLRHNFNDITQIQQTISEVVLKFGQYLAGSAFLVGKGTFNIIIDFSIMLYLLFFLLKDGNHLIHYLFYSFPLPLFIKRYLFSEFAAVARSIVKGTIIIASIQGTLGGIAFYIVDIDGSIFWGTLMALLSIISSVMSTIIWIPAIIYLFSTQKLCYGFFIIGFFLLIIGLVDNFLRPLLVGKDTRIPDFLVFISTLGGMEIYGINGFIIGPLITALFISCWHLLSNYYSGNINQFDKIFIKKDKIHSD